MKQIHRNRLQLLLSVGNAVCDTVCLLKLLLVLQLLLVGNRQGIDAKEVADAVGHQERPAEVDNCRKREVGVQINQLILGRQRLEAEKGQVCQDGTSNERHQHDCPVREWLPRQMGKDHLGRHAPKDKRHGQAEEDEVVLAPQSCVRRVQPSSNRERVDGHGCPFEEDGQNWQLVAPPSLDDIVNAEGNMANHEGSNDDQDPNVANGVLADQVIIPEKVL